MSNKFFAWVFLIIFIMDSIAIWATAFITRLSFPWQVQIVLIAVFLAVVIGTIILIHKQNNDDDQKEDK